MESVIAERPAVRCIAWLDVCVRCTRRISHSVARSTRISQRRKRRRSIAIMSRR